MDFGFTVASLSGFTGRPMSYYDDYVEEALSQAEDLLELATGLTEPPTDPLLSRVAERGVLAMAEALYEGQQYRSLRFSPFRSQTIGSYSYSLAEHSVLSGVPTRVAWFDLAVRTLGDSNVTNTSVSAFDRPGDVLTDSAGGRYLTGPADTEHLINHPAG